MVFVAGMGKGNYLIPVSVTKYLCHSSMSSKNFNDTQKLTFLSESSLRVGQLSSSQRSTIDPECDSESGFAMAQNGSHYSI